MNHAHPRTLADGRVCCSRSDVQCDDCKAHHARRNLAIRTNTAPVRKTDGEWRNDLAQRLGVGSIVTDDPVDSYASAHKLAPVRPKPQYSPGYNPYGQPPDIYEIGLALRKMQEK